MINARLSIYRPAPFYEWVDIGLTGEIPVSVNYAVADIREPDKRNASFSKTIQIPGTKAVNNLFELIFEVNIALQNFNPNLKTKARYFVDNDRVFNGNLQLLKIIKDYEGETLYTTYECSIVGEANDLIVAFGDKYLHDINFSGGFNIDHSFDISQVYTQPAYMGEGYCYNWAKYGIPGDSDAYWIFENLKPAIFERFYLRKMFYDAGKTWTSAFLDSAYYKRIIIPCVKEGNLQADAVTIANAQFYAGKTADTTTAIAGASQGLGNWKFPATPFYNFATASYNDDSSAPFFDPGAVYGTGTNTFTCNYTSRYNIVVKNDFEVKIVPPAGTVYYTCADYQFRMDVLVNGIVVGGGTATVTPNISTYVTFTIYTTIPNYLLTTGDAVATLLYTNDVNSLFTNFKDVSLVNINAGTCSVSVKQKQTSVFYGLLVSTDLTYGSTVVMNDTIPQMVKQRDFFMGIVQAENLYIMQDPENENNYIIEPRDSFIQTTNALDWTYKLDTSKTQEVVPMGELDFKNLLFAYKSDKDYFNQQYETVYRETYGTKIFVTDNEFVKSQKKTELIFSATPVVDNPYNDIICPKIYQADVGQTNIKPMAANIRRLYWKGQTSCIPYSIWWNNTLNALPYYNFAGMVDDPLAPTISLDWGIPRTLYYTYPGLTNTDNNLYNRNYYRLIKEITDKDSKIVKAYIKLTPKDIAEFSFRRIVLIEDAYYFVNKISDYNPNDRKSTLCELLKLKVSLPYTPVSFPIVLGLDGFVSGQTFFPGGNFGEVVGGANNKNMGSKCVITGGANNFIG